MLIDTEDNIMAISFKKMFKKDETEATSAVMIEQPAAEQATTIEENNDAEKKKGKHGEPGVCCGSCS